MSAVSRPIPSSGPLASRYRRSRAVTRPPWQDTPSQDVVLPVLQTSPCQVAARYGFCAGQKCAQVASAGRRRLSLHLLSRGCPRGMRHQMNLLVPKQALPCQVADASGRHVCTQSGAHSVKSKISAKPAWGPLSRTQLHQRLTAKSMTCRTCSLQESGRCACIQVGHPPCCATA